MEEERIVSVCLRESGHILVFGNLVCMYQPSFVFDVVFFFFFLVGERKQKENGKSSDVGKNMSVGSVCSVVLLIIVIYRTQNNGI